MMRNENCWEFQITQTRYPPSGTFHRPTFGGSDAGNKHQEVAFSVTVTPHHLTFIFNSFNMCPFCHTTEKLKEIKTAKDKAMHKGDTKATNK